MRTIKFRVYDKLVNKMLDVKQITYSLSGKNMGVTSVLPIYRGDWKVGEQSRPLLTGEYELMQFTGLSDKSGKEIYEGDIVQIGIGADTLVEEVKWVDENNWMNDKCPVNGWVNHESIYKEKPEIIGNIYSNPELLTKENK